MGDAKPHWHGALLKQLQGPSSLGMAVSGGAVGFSASIIDPAAYENPRMKCLAMWLCVVLAG